MIMIFTAVLIVIAILFGVSTIEGNMQGTIWALLIPLTLILIFFVFFKRYYTAKVKGLPVEDERSKKVKMYAAGYAYYISLYIWLALMFFRDNFNQSQIFVMGMLGMTFSFLISWMILDKKDNL